MLFMRTLSMLMISGILLLAAGCGGEPQGPAAPEETITSSGEITNATEPSTTATSSGSIPASTAGSTDEPTTTPTTSPTQDNTTDKANPAADFRYTVEEDHVRIDGYVGSSPTMIIPAEIEGKPVTHLLGYAFSNADITHAVIPKTVTKYVCAFERNLSLETVILEEGITNIDEKAFLSCEHLRQVTLPSTLKSIGDAAFASCKELEEILLPEGLQSIGGSALRFCVSLTTLRIPASVTDISTVFTFSDCYGLSALEVAEGNPNYVVVDGVLFSKDMDTLYNYPCARPGEFYVIPASVKTLAIGAFFNPLYLQEVQLMPGMMNLPSDVFFTYEATLRLTSPGGRDFCG